MRLSGLKCPPLKKLKGGAAPVVSRLTFRAESRAQPRVPRLPHQSPTNHAGFPHEDIREPSFTMRDDAGQGFGRYGCISSIYAAR